MMMMIMTMVMGLSATLLSSYFEGKMLCRLQKLHDLMKTMYDENCCFHPTLGSLSMQRFRATADTGSVHFSHFTCLHTSTFIFLSLFALVETITLKIWERPMSWPAKCLLPVAVRGSKTLHA